VPSSLKELLDRHEKVTILSHIDPDADAIGTSLGIYAILKGCGKRVEVVNISTDLPHYLDFLPGFQKIKHAMGYDDSLVIACDCGSIDRLGFDLEGREIVNIDHHATNTRYGTLNFVNATDVASSQTAYGAFSGEFAVSKDAATCFYTALLSDTRHFTTNNVTRDSFSFAMELLGLGVDHSGVVYNLTMRSSLASVRLLGRALGTLRLHRSATVASIIMDREMFEETGALMSDTNGIVAHAHSLANVDVAIALIERADGIKVSLRSSFTDVAQVARSFGGGGHTNAAGFTLRSREFEEVLGRILEKLES